MKADQYIQYLKLENNKLRTEATALRKRLKESSRHAKRVRRAFDDALLLAIWKVAQLSASRDYANQHGMTQNRWQSAIALLKMARVVTRYRHWVTTDLALIETRLTNAQKMAIEHPESFFLRLNRHGQR